MDTTCITDITSCRRKGACQLYDVEMFRFRIHGLALLLKSVGFFFYVAAYFAYKRSSQYNIELDDMSIEKVSEDVQINPVGYFKTFHMMGVFFREVIVNCIRIFKKYTQFYYNA